MHPRFDTANFPDQALFSRILAFQWLRYELGCYAISFERYPFNGGSDLQARPDALGLTKRRLLAEVEIKITLSDMKADLDKPHRQVATLAAEFQRRVPSVPSYLYYMVPPHLVSDALQLFPSFVGVISRHPTMLAGYTGFPAMALHRKAVKLHDKRIPARAVFDMVRDMGGTMASLLADMACILQDHPEHIHNGHLDYDHARVLAREHLPQPGHVTPPQACEDHGDRTGKKVAAATLARTWRERQRELGPNRKPRCG